MALFYQPLLARGTAWLDEDESRHAVQVLRLAANDTIEVTDGLGFFYTAVVENPNNKKCTFRIVAKKQSPKRKFHIHIAIAPTKSIDRTEWFVEKAVELGVDQITLMRCNHSERKVVNLERMQKVAVSALKQSRQAWMPTISGLKEFKEVVCDHATEKFIAFVDETNPQYLQHVFTKSSDYLIFIGPEGDFTPEELATALSAGFIKVSLGAHRLRTETAGVAAVHILSMQ